MDFPPWPMLGIILQTEKSQVLFPVRAHAWIVGLVPGQGVFRRQVIDVSLPLFFPPFTSL